MPSPRLAVLLSIAIAVHFTLIGISYLSTVAASSVQADLLATFGPYLVPDWDARANSPGPLKQFCK